jgi:hypothetical protein
MQFIYKFVELHIKARSARVPRRRLAANAIAPPPRWPTPFQHIVVNMKTGKCLTIPVYHSYHFLGVEIKQRFS